MADATDTLTADLVDALFALVRALPGVVGNSISGDEERIESATSLMEGLRERLADAGIIVDDRFTSFPSCLARLGQDIEQWSVDGAGSTPP